MRVVIISDLHDNTMYLEKCVDYCKKTGVDIILCCGDITNNETVASLATFEKPVYFIRGNADNFTDTTMINKKNLHYLGRTGEVVIDNKKIGLCHEPFFITDMLPNHYTMIFYGHTHKPWIETKEATHVINPGTLGGVSNYSTFAFWDTTKPLPELIQTNLL